MDQLVSPVVAMFILAAGTGLIHDLELDEHGRILPYQLGCESILDMFDLVTQDNIQKLGQLISNHQVCHGLHIVRC